MELLEERQHEREVQREKLDKAYEQLYLKQHWQEKKELLLRMKQR